MKRILLYLAVFVPVVLGWCFTDKYSVSIYDCPAWSEYKEGFYDDGKYKFQWCFKANSDIMNWYWIYYDENGQIEIEWMIIDDQSQWEWKYYHENGQLSSIWNYKDDLEDGSWKYYDEDGTFIGEEIYENWVLIDRFFEDWDNEYVDEIYYDFEDENIENIADSILTDNY